MNDLQNQESFSFSTSLKTGLFSDDENGGVEIDHRTRSHISGHHQKDYLEISLSSPPSALITKITQNDKKEEEFEFCFSFNSSSALRDFPATTVATSNHPFHSREAPVSTSTCTTSQVVDVVHNKYKHQTKTNNSIHYKRIFQRVSSPQCHQRLLSPYVFRTPIDDRGATRSRRSEKDLPKLKNRKSGGMRKFMVKLKSIKGIMLNLSRRLQPSPVDKKTKKTFADHKLNRTDLQRSRGLMTIKNGDDNNSFVTNTTTRSLYRRKEEGEKSIKFDGFGKMMDVIMKNIRMLRRSKEMGSKSCPVSMKSSPMHDIGFGNTHDERRNSFYSRDHSIQAAIAHCKKSFGK